MYNTYVSNKTFRYIFTILTTVIIFAIFQPWDAKDPTMVVFHYLVICLVGYSLGVCAQNLMDKYHLGYVQDKHKFIGVVRGHAEMIVQRTVESRNWKHGALVTIRDIQQVAEELTWEHKDVSWAHAMAICYLVWLENVGHVGMLTETKNILRHYYCLIKGYSVLWDGISKVKVD